jgi:hypothetical protein
MPETDRFMSHVAKQDYGCWLWTAFRMKNGYGNFRTPARHELAHRASYRLFNGVLDERDVMHSCDNPSCVNPNHLSLGTRADNMKDAKAKGRNARGDTHGMSKITEADAIQIRRTTSPQAAIAAQYGLSQSTISQIRTGKRWAYLQL